jgi:hypothetical protein
MQADKNSSINSVPANNNTASNIGNTASTTGAASNNTGTNNVVRPNPVATATPPATVTQSRQGTVEREVSVGGGYVAPTYYQQPRAPEVVVVPSSPQVVYVPTPVPSASMPMINNTGNAMPIAPMASTPVAYTGQQGGHSPLPWILGGLLVVAVIGGVVYMARQ